MSELLTPENIGNVILFLAPGFLARQIYRSIFSTKELGDTPALIVSAAYSLPIIALANLITEFINRQYHHHIKNISSDWHYLVITLVVTVTIGYGCVLLRKHKHSRRILEKLGFSGPEPSVYQRIMAIEHPYSTSIVTLKDGRSFSGNMAFGQVGDDCEAKALYFINLRWPDTRSRNGWGNNTKMAMLVPLESINFIQLDSPLAPTTHLHRLSRLNTLVKKIASKLVSIL